MSTSDRHSPHPNPLPPGEGTGSASLSPRERGGVRGDPILHVRRDDLRPNVREYTDNLRAQVAVVLRDLGVKDIAEYEQLVRERRVPEAKVRAFKELMAQFAEAVKNNTAPETPEDEAEREYHERVVDFVRRAVDAGGLVHIAVEAIAGIGTEEAWKLREEAFIELQKDKFTLGTSFIVDSLAGLDDDRSWDERQKISGATSFIEFADLGKSLMTLNNTRAWDMRERLLLKLRERLFQVPNYLPGMLALSVSGVHSMYAWDIRESQFETCVKDPHNIKELLGDNLYAGLRFAQRRERRQRVIGI